MADATEVLDQIKQSIEARLRDAVARHQRTNPNFRYTQIVDLQIRHEKERLEKLNEQEPEQAEIWHSLIEWLPIVARQFKQK